MRRHTGIREMDGLPEPPNLRADSPPPGTTGRLAPAAYDTAHGAPVSLAGRPYGARSMESMAAENPLRLAWKRLARRLPSW